MSSSTSPNVTPSDLISTEARLIFQGVVYSGVATVISGFGIVANIVNIICFVRQGLKDSITINLLGLAIADLGCLVTSFLGCQGLNPAFTIYDVPINNVEVLYVTNGIPHVIFTCVSSWLTALITLERCLCITMPLKVKSLITPKRTKAIMISLFVVFTSSVAPGWYANRLAMKFSPARNKTILGLVYSEDQVIVDQIWFAINNAFIPFSAYVTIITCTAILVINLKKKANWRAECTTLEAAESTYKRDMRVAGMVVAISTLFITCFIPLCITFTALYFVPGLTFGGPYENMVYVLGGISLVMESVNSAANIFIYYRMSSRYRSVVRQLLCREKPKEQTSVRSEHEP